jgi:hypothetical protein
MNVFVLCTGRCGSTTFSKACAHMHNYSAKHESRSHLLGDARMAYPDNHIEADNRLSWLLGRLEARFGDQAFYVHLMRDPAATARSFVKRWDSGILLAYRTQILLHLNRRGGEVDPLDVCLDYCNTVNTNVRGFLQGKPLQMEFRLENAAEDFRLFWDRIGAQGDFDAAVSEWGHRHNASSRVRPAGRHR